MSAAIDLRPEDLVLAALAAGEGASHAPVQVQKLLFLADENLADELGGKKFNFAPYHYGPFDRAVNEVLENLAERGLVERVKGEKFDFHRLTDRGQDRGAALLNALPDRARSYLLRTSSWIRERSFTELVSAIYKAYPEMRANSVFQDR